jgi:hypothetical protein
VRHTTSDLEAMVKFCPQFLAVVQDDDDDHHHHEEEQQHPQVVGYTLTVDSKAIMASPSLEKLYKVFFDMADEADWKTTTRNNNNNNSDKNNKNTSSSLSDMKWALGAQVCVAKEHRRKGILQSLYQAQVDRLAELGFEATVTAVDHANLPSLRSHERAQFEVAARFPTGGRDDTGWSLIARKMS